MRKKNFRYINIMILSSISNHFVEIPNRLHIKVFNFAFRRKVYT